jgi:mannose-6-phosphate isomerase-like protein (cupin superfamily)
MASHAGTGKLEKKSMDSPDETRTPNKTRVELVNLSGMTLGRFNFEPGWRWSECVKPVVGTDSCQNHHVGYVVSGHLHIRLDDGSEAELKPGDAYEIPPGHDAWNDGDEKFVGIEVQSAAQYAKR